MLCLKPMIPHRLGVKDSPLALFMMNPLQQVIVPLSTVPQVCCNQGCYDLMRLL